VYYPGWKVFVDNKESAISYNNLYGVMELTIPAGSHTIEATFTETPTRMVSNVLSLLTGIGLAGLLGISLMRRKS
jgi:uncharacterized membrane protein YfhO